jgi:hypothetical protein
MTNDLLDLAITTTGGHPWNSLRGLKIDVSIGGPIWALKGWPPDKTFDQVQTLDRLRGGQDGGDHARLVIRSDWGRGGRHPWAGAGCLPVLQARRRW